MNYWITTDTHFGHTDIKEWASRPDNFEALILKRLTTTIKKDDVLIHLGDVSWKNDIYWHKQITSIPAKKRWLLRGNHDKKGAIWYLDNGWDFIANSLTINIYGKTIVFSHVPLKDNGYDLNIHGHFHNLLPEQHEPELVAIKNDRQILIMLEHTYMPLSLKSIVKANTHEH